MNGFFAGMEFWYWWALAGMLLVIEILAPVKFFLWISIAAVITGLLALVIDMSGEMQILVFSAWSVISIILSRIYLKRNPIETENATLNRRGEQYIGKTYQLVDAIENGVGRVKVNDSLWRVEGEDMPAGRRVTVTAINGSSFVVKVADY